MLVLTIPPSSLAAESPLRMRIKEANSLLVQLTWPGARARARRSTMLSSMDTAAGDEGSRSMEPTSAQPGMLGLLNWSRPLLRRC